VKRDPFIRVLIVDDHAMVRRGMAAFLRVQPDLELVGEASNGREAVRLCETLKPDVILMDMVMPVMDGSEATRSIRVRWPEIQIIALTSFKDRELVQSALAAGAIGYLYKNVSTDELAEAIRSAYGGRATVAVEAIELLALAERLEDLERDVRGLGPDLHDLSALLERQVPALLPDTEGWIRLNPDGEFVRWPSDVESVSPGFWSWIRTCPAPRFFPTGDELPWGGDVENERSVVVAPILDIDNGDVVGGIIVRRRQATAALPGLIPAVQGLSLQIGMALRSAKNRAQALASERVVQDLALAAQIQSSFLPSDVPSLAGWQVAVCLRPANEVSGDFYDLIALPNGRWGFLVADVAGKGMGAALVMAMCRTLIRTYSTRHPDRPDLVLAAANHHMLADTRSDLFVSVFYGILDPASGLLTYANAGHLPPLLWSADSSDRIGGLARTGMVLGVLEEAEWESTFVLMGPGSSSRGVLEHLRPGSSRPS